MKRFLCMVLACLLLAAGFAVAEDETAGIPKERLLELERYIDKETMEYVIPGECEAYRTVTLCLEKSMTERQNFWPIQQSVVERSSLTADVNGAWTLRLPVFDQYGKDYLADYGSQKIVYLWGKYKEEGNENYVFLFALQRPDVLPDPAAQQQDTAAAAEKAEYIVPTSEFHWQVSAVSMTIQLMNDDQPFANQDVRLCVQGNNSKSVPGKTDAEGKVDFTLTKDMLKPGTKLEVRYSKNQDLITILEVPETPTSETITVTVYVTPDPEQNQGINPEPQPAPAEYEKVLNSSIPAPEEKGVLLKGVPDVLVYILCAVFLAGYGVCWFALKHPEQFGSKRGRGV